MKHILFVDDNLDQLTSIERLLHKQKDKWGLNFVQSADDALAFLEKHDIDLIICDILMPQTSGLKLLKMIKANEVTRHIPVIMITGQIDPELKFDALEMGAVDLINKPFDKVELLARIRSSLRLKTYHDQIIKQNLMLEKEIRDRKAVTVLAANINFALIEEEKLNNLLQKCCQLVVNNLEVAFARIWLFDHQEDRLELMASAGMYTHINGNHQYISVGEFKIGRIAQNKKPYLTNSVIGDPQVRDQEWAIKEKMVAFAGHPLIVKNRMIGVLGMFSKIKLTAAVLDALSSIADGLALGIVQKKAADNAHFHSFYDSLTRLPNHRLFNVFLGKMLNYSNRYLKRFSLVLIDINDFNRINESLGRIIGDRCLKVISQRLSTTLRDSDHLAWLSEENPAIARIDGDKFALLLQDTSGIHPINRVIHRLYETLSKSMRVAERDLILSASIGVAVYPDDANSIVDLLKNAETALHYAKEKGKNDFAFYSQSMNESSLEMLDFEINLRKAIKKKEFCLYYQPKVALNTNKIIGAEALIRWETEDGKMISPAQFIPLAEEMGMIIPIGDWVIETACLQNMTWQTAGLEKIPLAVNVSGHQFGQKKFSRKVLNFLETSGLSPEYLELEITETAMMINPKTAIQNLNELKKYGIKIAMDDFGTGYSSLAYLQKFPVDQLKIDLSFIKNVLSNPNDAMMVKAIISMAHNLGLKVIAEGVEDINQLEFLSALNCDAVQGYLFSRPVSVPEFTVLLEDSFEFTQLDGKSFPSPKKVMENNSANGKTISL